jgi:uncharacterized membrane protein
MTDELALFLFTTTRVLHVGTAIVLVGGSVFLRYVLMPAASATLADDTHAQLRARLMDTWKKFVHGGIALLLLTGAINYTRAILLIRATEDHRDPVYHGVMGLKILLALGIFFIASVLVGRSPKFEAMRQNSRYWIGVNVALAAVIVILSAFLRVRGIQ